jgi:hypothetical protein
MKRAEKVLLKYLQERDELEKGLAEVKAIIQLKDDTTDYGKRAAFKLAVDKLFENNDVDIKAGVTLDLDYDAAYLTMVAVARGWVRK